MELKDGSVTEGSVRTSQDQSGPVRGTFIVWTAKQNVLKIAINGENTFLK